MHKLTKGLKKTKKKKKGKKKGHEDELFNAAELEEYRRTHQQQEDGPSAEDHEQGSEADEWRQFKALTAGVDTVLKKTQDDLDRIRSTSYFQRKKAEEQQRGDHAQQQQQQQPAPTAPKREKKWVGFEEGAGATPLEDSEQAEEQQSGAAAVATGDLLSAPGDPALLLDESAAEESSEEEEDDEDDGLFDTSYVDAVTSGEVKLAYVPDSPELEQPPPGEDPFDTSYVEDIARQAEEELKRKPAVVIDSSVVQVLAGKAAAPPSTVIKRPSPKRQTRRAQVDLLLGSFDENGNEPQAVDREGNTPQPEPQPRSLLDELDEVEPPPPEDAAPPLSLLIDTAAPNASATPQPSSPARESDLSNLVAEFDLISEAPRQAPVVQVLQDAEDDDLEDEFAALAKESASRKESFQESFQDPFDTTAAAAVLGGADTESLDGEVEAAFSNPPPVPKSPRTFPISPDVDIVLATAPGSPSGWAAFDDDSDHYPTRPEKPARPPPPHETFPESDLQALADICSAGDPFDTSFAEGVALAPEDDSRILEEVRSAVSIHVTDPEGDKWEHRNNNVESELTSLTPGHRDLLGGSTTDLSKLAHDPIEPVSQTVDAPDEFADPFDTSVVDAVAAPGKAELKFLEQELLEGVSLGERRLSDPDFDPRAEQETAATAVVQQVVVEAEAAVQKRPPDLLGAAPKVVSFDLPTPSERPDLLAVEEDKVPISKPLTPYYSEPKTIVQEIIADPFDTSFAENLAPGKAELRLLESELLVDDAPQGLRHSLSDPDFDPRGEETTQPPIPPPATAPTAAAGAAKRRSSEAVPLSTPPPDPPGAFRRRFSDVTGDRGPRARTLPPPTSLPLALSPIKGSRPDLLLVEEEEAATTAKPLTPVVGGPEPQLPEIEDPFDTSGVADNLLPGKAELKVLESELIGGPLKRSYTDPDFDPRALEEEEARQNREQQEQQQDKPDLLNLLLADQEVQGHKPLTPQADAGGAVTEITATVGIVDDPFDTSIVENLVAPGRAELRALESELIGQ